MPDQNATAVKQSIGTPTVQPQNCSAIEFHDVSLTIGSNHLIHNINCRIDPLGTTVVMGPNGAGKSLFLRLLAGLLQPTKGRIIGGVTETGNGVDAGLGEAHGNSLGGGLSMVFQNPVLLRRTAFANLAYVLRQRNLNNRLVKQKVDEALVSARLAAQAQISARRLSGGEQQRLALARALVVDPAALLLDEATANLDPASTHIVECMAEEASKRGTKVIFVTHDIKQAKRIADDVLFIHLGRVMSHKPARDFFLDPGSDEAQAYLDGRVPDPTN
jgi:tungstate transport system ATP-binding protein